MHKDYKIDHTSMLYLISEHLSEASSKLFRDPFSARFVLKAKGCQIQKFIYIPEHHYHFALEAFYNSLNNAYIERTKIIFIDSTQVYMCNIWSNCTDKLALYMARFKIKIRLILSFLSTHEAIELYLHLRSFQ